MDEKDKEIVFKYLLAFKGKTLVDQSERSANIDKEMNLLKDEVKDKIESLATKIKNVL